MTPGTSPHGGNPSAQRTVAVGRWGWGARPWPPGAAAYEINWSWLARGAAALHLLGLGLIVTMAWHDANLSGVGTVAGGLPVPHLAFLMATGAAAAFLTLGSLRDAAAAALTEPAPAGAGANQLLAQMSHELRTPLNAVIGFSEVMLRELHGPLGHARYQEYAAHISESGGQLLKVSEDTLAVTATMSALMANRLAVRRDRVLAATLVRDAWATVAAGAASREIQLAVTNCNSCTIECERRGTAQALEHLLREAIAKAPAGGVVQVKGRRRGGARSIEMCVRGPVASAADLALSTTPSPRTVSADRASGLAANPGPGGADIAGGGSLRVILAGLLLEIQGATLSQSQSDEGTWLACAAFPGKG